MSIINNLYIKYGHVIFIFIITITVASVFSIFGVDAHHQGIMFKPALDVAHGQMLFRDTFTQYGAMTTLLHALVLKLFGDHLLLIQIQTAIFYGFISICLWYLWRPFLAKWLTTVSVLIWLFIAPYFVWTMLPWSSVPALLFQLLSLLIIFRALQDHNRLMIIFSGCVAVLVFWCRQPVGVFHCASIIIFLCTTPIIVEKTWKRSILDCSSFILGIIIGSLPFIVWLVLNGALYDMYLQSIKAAFHFGILLEGSSILYNPDKGILISTASFLLQVFSKLFPIYYGSGTSPMWSILPIVCLFLFIRLLVFSFHNRQRMDNQLTLYGLLLISLFSWLQYYPVNCIRHVYWAATPMIGMVPYSVLSMTPHKKTRIQNQIICLILVSIFGLDISYRIYSGFNRITKHNIRIEEPLVLRGMYATPYKERLCRNMSNAIEKDVNKNTFPYILTLSNDPLYITFIGPQYNYHPMYVDWSPLNEYIYPDFKRRRDLFIEKNNPVILGFNDTPIPGAICVDTFNVYGFRQQSKLALYIFEDKKQHNLLGQNAVIGEL